VKEGHEPTPTTHLHGREDGGVDPGTRDRPGHRSVAGENRAVGDPDVPRDGAHAADLAVSAHDRAAGHADHGRHDGVGSDADVVSDLDEIVELDPVFDHGVLDRAAVDARVGPDIDIVADADASQLGDPVPALAVVGVAEPVGSEHRTRMDDDPPTDRDVGADVDRSDEARRGPDAAPGSKAAARTEHGVILDDALLLEDAVRTDRGAGSHTRRRMHDRRRMNARRRWCVRSQTRGSARVGELRTLGDQHCARAERGVGGRKDDDGRPRRRKTTRVGRVGHERERPFPGPVQGRDVRHRLLGPPAKLRAGDPREFPGGDGRTLGSCGFSPRAHGRAR
jgi:hypothetical protein